MRAAEYKADQGQVASRLSARVRLQTAAPTLQRFIRVFAMALASMRRLECLR